MSRLSWSGSEFNAVGRNESGIDKKRAEEKEKEKERGGREGGGEKGREEREREREKHAEEIVQPTTYRAEGAEWAK